jgi:hypothetical protein
LVEALCYEPEVEGSIPGEDTGFFKCAIPPSSTIGMGSTKPLKEMNIRNLPE